MGMRRYSQVLECVRMIVMIHTQITTDLLGKKCIMYQPATEGTRCSPTRYSASVWHETLSLCRNWLMGEFGVVSIRYNAHFVRGHAC
jgi:hypothetical protein